MKFRFAVINVVAVLTLASFLTFCGDSDDEAVTAPETSSVSTPSSTSPPPDTTAPSVPDTTAAPTSASAATINFDCVDPGSANTQRGAREPLSDSSPREDVPSALDNRFDESFDPVVDPSGIKTGGPPPEGIPTIDVPCYVAANEVEYLSDTSPVMAVEINGDARAFPLGIMTAHELVNDNIGGVPVTVSYCPLCNSGVVYDRRVADRVLDFGTSGSLYQSSLVMYDRQTQSLWTHFNGQAVVGHLEREQLDFFPTQIASWKQWQQANPDGVVLSRETGYYRPESYVRNPYTGYESGSGLLSSGFQSEEIDDRLPTKERVIGISFAGGGAIAVRHQYLRDNGVAHFSLESEEGTDVPLVAFNISGTNSALDTEVIDQGLDVGSSAVFSAEAAGQQLMFEPNEDDPATFIDTSTGSTWNIFGRAVAGELEGEQLEPVVFLDTFWFAWSTFAKGTDIFPNE